MIKLPHKVPADLPIMDINGAVSQRRRRLTTPMIIIRGRATASRPVPDPQMLIMVERRARHPARHGHPARLPTVITVWGRTAAYRPAPGPKTPIMDSSPRGGHRLGPHTRAWHGCRSPLADHERRTQVPSRGSP
ncbi:hypothetical protein GCM10009608_38710 [Pseudonocardia alaniniphila]